MIKTQLWHPDTCDQPSCIVEETYDTTDPGATMVMSAVIRKCSAHALVADTDLYNVLYRNADSDQKRKNLSEKYLTQTDSLNLNQTRPDGAKVWKDGVTYQWSFTGVGQSRVLTIAVVGANLNPGQRTTIQTVLDAQFGVGRVILA